jgi:hypothetical protein
MSNKKLSDKTFKAICSVTELCKDLGISRAQFYNLQNMEVFPKGLKDERTGRPYFDVELQIACHQVRSSCIGHDGQPYLFYSPRTKPGKPRSKVSKPASRKHKEYALTLEQMGLSVSLEEISKALPELYPDGSESIDERVVIRALFRHFRGS